MNKKILIWILLGCMPIALFAKDPEALAQPTLRGFAVGNLNADTLRDAKEKWGVNIVRWQLNVIDMLAKQKNISKQEAWDEVFATLPAGLDTARALGITVVISFPQLSLTSHDPTLANKEVLAQFWQDKDGKNLETWITAWKRIATLCAARPEQGIWFDLMNEPLDWTQMPSYPKQWPIWAQRLIDEIRRIDTAHPIVIEPGPGSLCWGFKTFPLLLDNNLIYSLHQYQPVSYTHQGVEDIRNTDLAKPYLERQRGWPGQFGDHDGGHWDQNRIATELEPVFDFLKRNPGARIYVGEFSVIRWAPNGAQYLRDNIDIFEQHGWDWTYHAFREWPGWSPEYNETYSTPENSIKSTSVNSRGAVLLEFLKRNTP